MNWLCWHVGTVNDPKFGRIADVCRTSRANVIAVWAVILENARDGRGIYTLTYDDAAYALGIDVAVVENIHLAMKDRGLVDGQMVCKWSERQGNSNSERAREWRERRRTSPNVASVQEQSRTIQTDRQTYTQTEKDMALSEINPETIAQNEKNAQSDFSLLAPVASVTPATPSIEDEFSEWYSIYPRKVGKGQARRAFVTARKKTDQKILIAGVHRLLKNLPSDPKFIPHPSTWLNGERWADDPRSVKTQTLTQKILSSNVPG